MIEFTLRCFAKVFDLLCSPERKTYTPGKKPTMIALFNTENRSSALYMVINGTNAGDNWISSISIKDKKYILDYIEIKRKKGLIEYTYRKILQRPARHKSKDEMLSELLTHALSINKTVQSEIFKAISKEAKEVINYIDSIINMEESCYRDDEFVSQFEEYDSEYQNGCQFFIDHTKDSQDIISIDICSHTGSTFLYQICYAPLYKELISSIKKVRILLNSPDISQTMIPHFYKHVGAVYHIDINSKTAWKDYFSRIFGDWKSFQSSNSENMDINITKIPILHSYLCIHKKNEAIALVTFYTYGVKFENQYRIIYDEGSADFKMFQDEFEVLWKHENATCPISEFKFEPKDIASLTKTVSTIRTGKGEGHDDFLAHALKIDKNTFNQIVDMIDTNPSMSDEDIASAIFNF